MTVEVTNVFSLLDALDENRVSYLLFRQPDCIIVSATLPGKRIEIICYSDGSMDTSVFSGDESVVTDKEFVLKLIDGSE